jgi:hypothetical protein
VIGVPAERCVVIEDSIVGLKVRFLSMLSLSSSLSLSSL